MKRIIAFLKLFLMMNFVACSGRQPPQDSCTTGAFFKKQIEVYNGHVANVNQAHYMPGGFLTFKSEGNSFRCNMTLTHDGQSYYLWTARHCLNFAKYSDFEIHLWFGDGQTMTSGYQSLALRNLPGQAEVNTLKAMFDEELANERIDLDIVEAYAGLARNDEVSSCDSSLVKIRQARTQGLLPAITPSREDGVEDYQNVYCFSLDDFAVLPVEIDTSSLGTEHTTMLNAYKAYLQASAANHPQKDKLRQYRELLIEIGKQQRVYALARLINRERIAECLASQEGCTRKLDGLSEGGRQTLQAVANKIQTDLLARAFEEHRIANGQISNASNIQSLLDATSNKLHLSQNSLTKQVWDTIESLMESGRGGKDQFYSLINIFYVGENEKQYVDPNSSQNKLSDYLYTVMPFATDPSTIIIPSPAPKEEPVAHTPPAETGGENDDDELFGLTSPLSLNQTGSWVQNNPHSALIKFDEERNFVLLTKTLEPFFQLRCEDSGMFLNYQGLPLMGLFSTSNDNVLNTTDGLEEKNECRNITIPSFMNIRVPTQIAVNPNPSPSPAAVEAKVPGTTQAGNTSGTTPTSASGAETPNTGTNTPAATQAEVVSTFRRVASGDASAIASTNYEDIEQASSQGSMANKANNQEVCR